MNKKNGRDCTRVLNTKNNCVNNLSFYRHADNYIYEDRPMADPKGISAYFPIEVDTEFEHPDYDLNNPGNFSCVNITAQVKSVNATEGLICSFADIASEARHPIFSSEFIAIDYLQKLGYQTNLTRVTGSQLDESLPWLQFDLYMFFGVAELLRMSQYQFRKDIIAQCINLCCQGIEQGRRLRTSTRIKGKYFDWIQLPWLLQLNDYQYRVRISIKDTCAVHGNTSYKEFCNNAGVALDYKDVFTKADKARMLTMYSERSKDFDEYALGDLNNHKALLANADKFRQIYESLGLIDYFTTPKLTIGATVAKLFESSINKLFNAEAGNRNYINAFCKYGSADWIKQKKTTTAALNAKVDGGRCRNNRPTDTTAKGVLCDIDIAGCYGEGLRVQSYPLGIPVIIDYPVSSKRNKYLTLRQFRKKYELELVPGLWQARVSTLSEYRLKYKQDYLVSWIPPKDISKMVTDSDFAETDEWWTVDNIGLTKIFTNEVKHAIVTHDFLQWLDNVASPRQRKELMDSLIVETAMYYPASDRVDNVDELIAAHSIHDGENSCNVRKSFTIKRHTTKITIEQECHKWYAVNLGELLVTQLLTLRKQYPKKTSLNNLYKLCINTIYGDMVSPFFTVGNIVVGNNITARARTLAWCMEKGLHGWQSITDGCAFDLNRVLYPRNSDQLFGESTVNVYSDSKQNNQRLAPLGNCDSIELITDNNLTTLKIHAADTVIKLDSDESLKWINEQAWKHLRELFPGLDVLHAKTTSYIGNERVGQFEFETKGLFESGCFHGTANYALTMNGEIKYAMRSYSKKEHKTVLMQSDELQVIGNDFRPSEEFLNNLLSNSSAVERAKVFIRQRILKVGDYRQHYQKWSDTNVYPGCSIENPGLLREFSLSQFTYQDEKQFKSWEKEYKSLLNQFGQSYEQFFLNHDGTLNYDQMVKAIDAAIQSGKQGWFDGMDRRKLNFYRVYNEHPEQITLQATQKQLGLRYFGGDEMDAISPGDRDDEQLANEHER